MKRTHASRFRSSVVVLVLLLVTNAAIVISQTATVATVAPADVADSGAETSTEAPPATVVPAGGSGDDTSSASSEANMPTQTAATTTAPVATESPAMDSPSTTAPPVTEAPVSTTAAPTITETPYPATEVPTTAPVPTEAPTAAPTPAPVVDASSAAAAPATAANKRDRGSTQQRALDSFFRQNRVTVARETGISSGNFVTDPLTPRDEIAVTMPSNAHDRPRTKTADLIAGSAAQAFNRRTRPDSSASIDTPTDSHNDEYDSFTGRHNAPSVVSTGSSNLYRSDSSNIYRSDSVFSDTSSVSLGSIAPSSQRSVQTPLFPTRLDTVASSTARNSKRASSATSIGDVRDTNRSDRSSSDFSVFNSPSVASSDGDIYRISTQLIDVSALPATTSEKSEPNNSYPSNGRMSEALSEFSVDESYTSELTGTESFSTEFSVDDGFRTDDSFATVDSFATRTTQDTEDDRDSDSLVLRNSKESELSEGEI
ncbi:hypothetical protein Pcac1_g7321 [Phytophthora cactorum]|nr:hypothetical protein Pcac1_g7321 [Phytophthora cactorum]